MRLYEIVNEWYVEDYTFSESKSIWLERENAIAELYGIADSKGVELPHDQYGFTHNDDFFYILERDTDD